ncbi:MAG: hypothetical protein A4E45_00410 [Methanosaeta sp. PtaB.Bin039]|nr:MAG: hypothetical protein A4E45_00410 [Methanosaeta sp. PtaB.Bin039]OPY44485.1 MAG: hypothetical protein A4E47_01524 [Methanosaeta sp. PtaU1.Bin028]
MRYILPKSGLVRFSAGSSVHSGQLVDGKVLSDGIAYAQEEVTLLPPTKPSKLVCVGLNYDEHARELGMARPAEPILFLKPPSAVIGTGMDIVMPQCSARVDYEGELGVVISDRCKDVSADRAADHILGFTCFNDVTARDLQQRDGQWTRAKSFDTFAPFGPAVVRMDLDQAEDLDIETRVNGAVRQRSNTSDLIFGLGQLVQFISRIMTLEPGDIVATGTPPGVGPLQRGDRVEVEIEGLGTLQNRTI